MQVYRRFRLAPALARLLRKERGINERFAEGHFPAHPEREHYVSIAPDESHLVIKRLRAGANGAEERTEVPRVHAEALLDVCTGKVAYGRTSVPLAGAREAWADHLVMPGHVDLLTLTFDSEADAETFRALPWFGPEVTTDLAYERRSIALDGVPQADEVPLSNAALNALLDVLEDRAPVAGEMSQSLPAADRTAEPGQFASAQPPATPTDEAPLAASLDPERAADRDDPTGALKPESITAADEPAVVTPAASEGDQRPLEQVLSDLSQSLAQPDPKEAERPGPPEPTSVRRGWELRRSPSNT